MNNNVNNNINEPELLEEIQNNNQQPVNSIPQTITNQNIVSTPSQYQNNISDNIHPPTQNINYNQVNGVNSPSQNINNMPKQKKDNTGLIIAIVIIISIVLLLIFGFIILSSMVFISTTNINHNVLEEIKENKEEYNNIIKEDSLDKEIPFWASETFSLDGVDYKLNSKYQNLKNQGWYIDFSSIGYKNGYILNGGDKTYSNFPLQNQKFSDVDINIGFINTKDIATDATECDFWAIQVDNTYSNTPVSFSLPGGIKNGSSLEAIETVYGKPIEEENIYRSDSLKYTVYNYNYDYKIYLALTIYDDGGLKEFEYKSY